MKYGKISKIRSNSPAWDARIRPGDNLVSINGRPVRDILEYQYLCLADNLEIDVLRNGQILTFHISPGEKAVGIEFEEDLFDGVHMCTNSCIFCFLHQMPKGLRQSLYVRDDDFRLSLAHGNYITLTNITDDEMERIRSQRMSPIYISVHSTESMIRERMLKSKAAGRIMDQLHSLAGARINMHTQIVLCPGINDGEHLKRTISDLGSLYPYVSSIGVVPVGLTKYRQHLTHIEQFDKVSAGSVVAFCQRMQAEFYQSLGTRLVYPSDELHFMSGMPLPSMEEYEDFSQLENGIGISRLFIDELDELKESIGGMKLKSGKYVLLTGVLAAPMIRMLAKRLSLVDGVDADICIVKNKYFGETITVTGLLTGRDIYESITDLPKDRVVLIPDVALNGDLFLDGASIADLRAKVNASVNVVPASPKGLIEYLRS